MSSISSAWRRRFAPPSGPTTRLRALAPARHLYGLRMMADLRTEVDICFRVRAPHAVCAARARSGLGNHAPGLTADGALCMLAQAGRASAAYIASSRRSGSQSLVGVIVRTNCVSRGQPARQRLADHGRGWNHTSRLTKSAPDHADLRAFTIVQTNTIGTAPCHALSSTS